MTRKTLTQGNVEATITRNGQADFMVIVTRNGRCLHGIPSKHYTTLKRAEAGAKRMMAKA